MAGLLYLALSAAPILAQADAWQRHNDATAEATVAAGSGNYAEAERQLKIAIAEIETVGANDTRLALAYNNLAEIYLTQNRRADAAPYLRRALAVAQGTYGPDHDFTKMVQRNLDSVEGQVAEAPAAGSAKQRFEAGVAAYERGDFAAALRVFRPLAEKGDVNAQYNLGVMYQKGKGVAKSDAKAIVWFRKAAELGHAQSQFNLGVLHQHGLGVAKNEAEAVAWYRRAAEQGFAYAQTNLGAMYANGAGVAKDLDQAVRLFRRAAVGGDSTARQMYAKGLAELGRTAQEMDQAIAKAAAALDEGATAAEHGDFAKALRIFRALAEKGDARAQANLGVMYETGHGVKKDLAQAALWYRKAAEQGVTQAQYNIGNMYNQGRGVAKDYAKGAYWLVRAAEKGNAEAQFLMGTLYYLGYGVKRDVARTIVWLTKSAAQGHKEAQVRLRSLGMGTPAAIPAVQPPPAPKEPEPPKPTEAELRLDRAIKLNNEAWRLATGKDRSQGDTEKAVRLAREAIALHGKEPYFYGTLAAAYVAAGKITEAVAEQERAIALLKKAGKLNDVPAFEVRLDFYRSKLPDAKK